MESRSREESAARFATTFVLYCIAGGLALWIPLILPHLSSSRVIAWALSQSLALALVFAVVWTFNNPISKRRWAEIGLRLDWTVWKSMSCGGAIGGGMIFATFVLMRAAGALSASYRHPKAADLTILPALLAIQAVQVMSEELLFRTYALNSLARRMSRLKACILWGLFFGGLHLLGRDGNPVALMGTSWLGVAFHTLYFVGGLTMAGVLLNAAYFSSGCDVWFTFGLHCGWNLLGMHVFFSKRFFELTYSPIWWLGGGGNPEGSVLSMLVVFIAAAATLFLLKKPLMSDRTSELTPE